MNDIEEELPGLGAYMAARLLLGLQEAYVYTLGALLAFLAAELVKPAVLGIHPFGFLATAIRTLDGNIRWLIANGIEIFKYDAQQWFAWDARLNESIGGVLAYAAEETYGALKSLWRSRIPLLIAGALAPVALIAKQALTHSKSVATSVAPVVKAAPTIIQRIYTHPGVTVKQAESIAKAAVAAAIAVLPAPTIPRIGDLVPSLAEIKARLAKLEKALSLGAVVGLGAYALSQLGLGSQQCSNNKKLSKGVCGLSTKVLDDLLAGLVAVVGTVSLIELAEEYQKLIHGVEGEVVKFWRAGVAGAGADRQLGSTGL